MWNGFAVPAAWHRVIRLLALHGVLMNRTTGSKSSRVQPYMLTGAGSKRSHSFTAAPDPVTVRLPAGSALISAQQPEAKLAAALLEPDSPVSLLHGGYFDRLFEARVTVPNAALEQQARKELSGRRGLARDFAHRLAREPAFAADPARRLAYFLQHGHGNREPLLDVYPVYEWSPDSGG